MSHVWIRLKRVICNSQKKGHMPWHGLKKVREELRVVKFKLTVKDTETLWAEGEPTLGACGL